MEKSTKEYFENNAQTWIDDSYKHEGYNYPMPAHRRRVLEQFLHEHPNLHKALDIGCGGGHLSIVLAQHALTVDSIDMSQNMLRIAEEHIDNYPEIKERIQLHQSELSKFSGEAYDIAVAMGLIGYLPSDDYFFEHVAPKIKKDGYVVVSFRNHLFNLFSISDNTQKDCDLGIFPELRAEYDSFSSDISNEQTEEFLQALIRSAQNALQVLKHSQVNNNTTPTTYQGTVQPRQSTPKSAIASAEKFGLSLEKMVGVHPHISLPSLNKKMPEGVYNILSDALIPLEEHPQALRWSSVFVGIFKKI